MKGMDLIKGSLMIIVAAITIIGFTFAALILFAIVKVALTVY